MIVSGKARCVRTATHRDSTRSYREVQGANSVTLGLKNWRKRVRVGPSWNSAQRAISLRRDHWLHPVVFRVPPQLAVILQKAGGDLRHFDAVVPCNDVQRQIHS